MSGRFLLDTNILIALLDGEPAVWYNLELAAEIFIPAAAMGELFYGAAESARSLDNVERLERFAAGRTILACDLDVARAYGKLRHNLLRNGRPIPENDFCITATALQHDRVLTFRERDCSSPGLRLPDQRFAPAR